MPSLTYPGSDGSSIDSVQPQAGSVAGSPFTVAGTAVATPVLSGIILVHPTVAIHVRFSKDGDAATTNDMLIPAGQITRFPADADVMSMISSAGSATVYVEQARER
jgi:hypothetical protein